MKIKDLHNEAIGYLKGHFWTLLGVVFLECLVASILTGIANQFDSAILTLIFSIAIYAITVPLSFGVIVSFMKVSRGESISAFDFVNDGMKSFKKVWAVFGRTVLKLLLPTILMVVAYIACIIPNIISIAIGISGGEDPSYLTGFQIVVFILAITATVFYIVKSLLYSLTSYILYDNPELTGKEIVNESDRMMKGYRGKYFLLSLYLVAIIAALYILVSFISVLLSSIIIIILGIILVVIATVILIPYAFAIQVAFYNLLRKELDGNNDPIETTEE